MEIDRCYTLVLFWFFFFAITFGCLMGGNEPKVWHTPTKTEVLKAWLMAVFWPITFSAYIALCVLGPKRKGVV